MTGTLRVAPWRVFEVGVRAAYRLSPSFVRLTLTGPDLDRFADNGYDQRFKLVFPGGVRRTYTVRAVRPYLREIDIDVVLHGTSGPASAWATAAKPGDRVDVIGPDAGYDGDHGGVEFRPPPQARTLLLAGDETAVPAVAAILERLPAGAYGQALLEVPYAADALALEAPQGITVTWLPREGAAYGSLLVPAVVEALPRLRARPGGTVPDEPDDLLWDVPDAAAAGSFYGWFAGEAGVVRSLRGLVDRRSAAFMGYWRQGRPEAG